MNCKETGDRSEAAVILQLVKRGYNVSIPFGQNHRYDAIIDVEGSLQRVQCKTGRLSDDGSYMEFNTCSTRKGRQSYRGQAEFFGVYCHGNDKTYLVPVNDVPESIAILRVTEPKNGQKTKIRMAKDYEVKLA